jgi:FAD/FMN-containing dehydrogenase
MQRTAIPGFDGEIVWPDDPAYDSQRRVWNAMHDRRPALIACCSSVSDVVAAVRYGSGQGLPIAVRCGGHSMPGHSVCDDGIVIDLRAMNAISVDAAARRATIQGGALLGEVDRATQRHGLVVPAGVVSHTGVGGLTLGGGVGRLMRRFGLTIDSLLSAEVVTAAGDVVPASPDELPDLFWGLRGGGGNFGIVTQFEFELHELSEIVMLATFHPLGEAAAVLEHAAHVMSDQPPDALLWTSFMRRAPDLPWVPPGVVGELGIVSVIEWSGTVGEGHERLGQIRERLAPGPASLATVPFLAAQSAGDEIFAAGKLTYIKAGFADRLSGGLIEALIDTAAQIGSPFSQIEVLALGGAIGRVAPEATAFVHRDAAWLINVPATWESPSDSDAEIAWARATYARLAEHLDAGTYVNFMDGDEDASTDTAYGRTLERLQQVKAVYDPDNLFRLNQNIQPVAAASR